MWLSAAQLRRVVDVDVLAERWTTSIRKPSTPRSSQNRSVSCIASRTAGVRPVEVGLARQEAVQVVLARGVVPRPRRRVSSTRAPSCWAADPSGVGVAPDVPVAVALSRDDRESTNHGWSLDVWLGTQSMSTRSPGRGPRRPARRSRRGAEDRVDVDVVARRRSRSRASARGRSGDSHRASTPSQARYPRRSRMPSRSPTPSPSASQKERG